MHALRRAAPLVVACVVVLATGCTGDHLTTAPGTPGEVLPPNIPPEGRPTGTGGSLFSDRFVAIDSTQLRLAGDAGERAAGVYRFEVVGPTPPSIAAEDYIAGHQAGGFLRRVIRATPGPGTLTLETAPATWHEVLNSGTYGGHVPLPSLVSTAPAGRAADGGPSPVALPPQTATFDDLDICLLTDSIVATLPGPIQPSLCGQQRNYEIEVSGVKVSIDGTITRLKVVHGQATVSGNADVAFALDAGGLPIAGTGRAPVFSPCNRLPGAPGCFQKVGTALRSFLTQYGVDPNVLPPLRVCIPGTPILVKARVPGSLRPFRPPVPPQFEQCRITDPGVLALFTQPWLQSLTIVTTPRLRSQMLFDVAGTGSLELQIPIPYLSAAAGYKIDEGIWASAKIGFFIQLKVTLNQAGGLIAVGLDETMEVTQAFTDQGGWSQRAKLLNTDVSGAVEPLGADDSLTARAAVQLEVSVGACLGFIGSSCNNPNDTDDASGFGLKVGAEAKAALARFVDATWSRDPTFENWHIDVGSAWDLTLEASVALTKGFKVQTGAPKKRDKVFEFGRTDIADLHGKGRLGVETVTTGTDPDPDGYTATVARADTLPVLAAAGTTRLGPPSWGDTLTRTIGPYANVLLSPSPPPCTVLYSDLAVGNIIGIGLPAARRLGLGIPNFATSGFCGLVIADYVVTLSGVAANCQVAGGPSKTVRLQQMNKSAGQSDSTGVKFDIVCTSPTAPLGALQLTVSSSGQDIDPDGYRASIDGADLGVVPVSGSITFAGLAPGAARMVQLTGLASNCSVTGSKPLGVSVPSGGTATLSLDVSCAAITGPTPGSIDVSVTTGGASLDTGYDLLLDGVAMGQLPADGSVTLSGLTPGPRAIQLSDVAQNCMVAGANPAPVVVETGKGVAFQFSVTCSPVALPQDATGSLQVRTTTFGNDRDADGYVVLIGGAQVPIGLDAQVDIPDLPPGTIRVALDGVAPNCVANGGRDPVAATVGVGPPTVVLFQIVCKSYGSLGVAVRTTGTPRDPDGYSVLVDGVERGVVGPNGAATIGSIPPGEHYVTLDGMAFNCGRTDDFDGSVSVGPGRTAQLRFAIACVHPALLRVLTVQVVTAGEDVDADGYDLFVDGRYSGHLETNGSLVVERLLPGQYSVQLSGIAANCAADGDNPKLATPAKGAASATFFVRCSKAPGP